MGGLLRSMGSRQRNAAPPGRDSYLEDFDRPGHKKHGPGRTILGLLVFICVVAGALVAADYGLNSGRIHGGVQVGTVPLGGKTPAEARKTIEERTTGALEQFELKGPEGFELAAEEIGVNFDVAASVQEAYSVGRRGNVWNRISERARASVSTITVPPKVDYQPEAARSKVENLADRLNQEPVEAQVEIIGSEVQVSGSSAGYKMNVPATVENVNRAVEDMTGEAEISGEMLAPEVTTREAQRAADKAREAMSGDLVLEAEGQTWTVSPADVGYALEVARRAGEMQVSLDRDRLKERLQNVYAALTAEPAEAGYDVTGTQVTVIPGQTGKSIQEEKLLGAIEAGIFEGRRTYRVPVVTAEPDLTTAEAEAMKPTRMLSRYRTNYAIVDDGPGRVKNLRIASKAINGTLLAPGEVFSANEILAPLDYYPTKVFINGKVDKADGGGLCQVASTLYMATNFAGLDVVERYPHYAELPYIRPGFDATVWFGSLDYKFQNDTDAYVLVREYVGNDGYIYAEIWGQPTGKEVSMYSEQVDSGPNSSTWVTYKTITQNGRTLFDGVLHRDTYEGIVDTDGKTVPPSEVPTAPVNP